MMNGQKTLPLNQIADKEIFLPLYVRNPGEDKHQVVCLPINYSELQRLLSSVHSNLEPTANGHYLNSDTTDKNQLGRISNCPGPLLDSGIIEIGGMIKTKGKAVTIYRDESIKPISYVENGKSGRSDPENKVSCLSNVNSSVQDRPLTDQLLASFLYKCCQDDASKFVSRYELQQAYDAWSEKYHKTHIAGNIIADYLNERYQTTKIKGKVHYVGISLKLSEN